MLSYASQSHLWFIIHSVWCFYIIIPFNDGGIVGWIAESVWWVELWPSPPTPERCLHPNTQNLWMWPYLVWGEGLALAYVIKLIILIWDHAGLSLNPMASILITRDIRGEDTQRRSLWKMKAEIVVMKPQTRECPEPPEAEREKEGVSPRVFWESTTLPTPWLWISRLRDSEGRYLSCCHLPCLWLFVRQP